MVPWCSSEGHQTLTRRGALRRFGNEWAASVLYFAVWLVRGTRLSLLRRALDGCFFSPSILRTNSSPQGLRDV